MLLVVAEVELEMLVDQKVIQALLVHLAEMD
jgi:hypothetical protein